MPQRVEQNTGDRIAQQQQGIVLDRLSAGYGKQIIVDDISLTIPAKKMTVLVGANGSGKSTLLTTIARMLAPLGGSVMLDGKSIHQQPPKPWPASWACCRSRRCCRKD